MPVPILIFSDAVGASSGLARITRDLAQRVHKYLPGMLKVGTIGYGSPGSSKLGWHQYYWNAREDYVIPDLPEIWADFAGSYTAPGIFMTVQDASRMLWLSHPEQVLNFKHFLDKRLAQFLKNPPFRKVGYFPIDAAGIDGKFTLCLKETYRGYDRVLAYTEWARKLVEHTLTPEDVERTGLSYIPHGIDTEVFYPRDREEARYNFFEHVAIKHQLSLSGKTVVGIVATNQSRKDYGLAFAALRKVLRTKELVIWVKTDMLERTWSLSGLAKDFGMDAFVTLSELTDESLAHAYSACDVTLGIGPEGFGFPIFESLACGCPVVHGNCAGAPEFMPKEMLIEPVAMRLETPYSVYRPVYEPSQMAEKIVELTTDKWQKRESLLPPRLAWSNLWKDEWEPYFKSLAVEKTMEACA